MIKRIFYHYIAEIKGKKSLEFIDLIKNSKYSKEQINYIIFNFFKSFPDSENVEIKNETVQIPNFSGCEVEPSIDSSHLFYFTRKIPLFGIVHKILKSVDWVDDV